MIHTIGEINMGYTRDTVTMACKMAVATIHSIYDDNKDASYLTDIDMHKVKNAMKVLCMAKDLLNQEPEKKTTGIGVVK